MASATKQTRPFGPRALLIFCALVSLCVSDTAGPRLVPLPAAPERAAAVNASEDDSDVIPSPSRGDASVAREAMSAPARKQAGSEQQPSRLASDAAEHLAVTPFDARTVVQTTRTQAPASRRAETRPPGRAPPPSA